MDFISRDSAVQGTNDDATVSKLSCVKTGYIKDNFVHHFVRRPVKRSPVINRGYFARWAAMRKLVDQFLSSKTELPKQIISLGSGFDTLYFQLQEESVAPFCYYEIDFKEVNSRKIGSILSNPNLKNKISPDAQITTEAGSILSSNYVLLSLDLRNIGFFDAEMKKAGLKEDFPTLIISECVLIYLDSKFSKNLIKWAANNLKSSIFIVYEQIHPNDAFGEQMIKNLESRGCALLGILDTSNLEKKKERFTNLGFKRADGFDMDVIYRRYLDSNEVKRIEKLEIFDEFEEWHIMQEHYCICYGINDENSLFDSFGLDKPFAK